MMIDDSSAKKFLRVVNLPLDLCILFLGASLGAIRHYRDRRCDTSRPKVDYYYGSVSHMSCGHYFEGSFIK